MAAPASRSAATSAASLRMRSPRSAALASSTRDPGSSSRKRSSIIAHIRSDTPIASGRPSRRAISRYGSSVSCHGTSSRSRPPAGDAWAAASSSRGTTMNGASAAGTTRQVSRSSGIAS